ncbi:MAG TPA: translesion DNA synthesis-associated protein ImuA [Gammaproteobacteria bacterium]
MAASLEALTGPHVWRGASGCSRRAVLATGFPALDETIGGGWPWGAVIEIFVARYGIGELRLLMPALAATSRSEAASAGWIVWIAPPFVPYAPALASHGVDVARVLLVRPPRPAARTSNGLEGAARPGPAAGEEALWATEQAVRSGTSAVVLAWVDSANDKALRRLQLSAEERDTGLVLFRPEAACAQRSPAALRLRVSADAAGVRVEVLKCRGGRPTTLILDLSSSASSGSFSQPAEEAAPFLPGVSPVRRSHHDKGL